MAVKGFKAAAAAAGMRYKNRLDLGLIAAEKPAAWAGVFTRNICRAAPVIWSKSLAAKGRGRAILVNAGQANAQTGEAGLADCRRACQKTAELLGCAADEVMMASTGVIGQPINMEALEAQLAPLASGLSAEALDDFAQAIITTDTFVKTAAAELELGGRQISIWGCAKGSGMIAPNMATMLAFVLTDASLPPELLQSLVSRGADLSFNRVTVDGDSSTNDSFFMMASGGAGAPELTGAGPDWEAFQEAAFGVMKSLARQIAKDGEGATKLVTVRLTGAATEQDAQRACRTVAESPLVKTAFFGADANWGRVCMALGRSGASFDPYAVDIDLDDVPWIRKGLDNGREEQASAVMHRPEYTLSINLNAGSAAWELLTCDFSHGYIDINGSYRS